MTLVSLWQDRHPRTPLVPAEVGGHRDVVVVGAGITGLTTALLLARAGRSVTVLEADHVGVGTTGRSTAKVSLLQGTQLSRISSQHSTDVVRQYVEANREGQAWLERFCGDHEVHVQHRPAYTFGFGEAGERAARREHDVAISAGLPVDWVDTPDLPFETRGAVRLPDQLQLDPCALLDELSRQAVAHGVELVEGARVRTVSGRSPQRVQTDAGEVTADTVVLATNTPILDRGGFFARIAPARSYTVAFRTPEQPVDGMYLSADSPSVSLRDAVGEDGPVLLVGGRGHTTGRGRPESERLQEIRDWTAEHFPAAEETHAWSAQDYVPHHALPFAGPILPGHDELLVAGGFSKWGLTNGVAAALALSGRILGGHQPWAAVLDTWTRRELTGAPRSALLNAEVAWEMASGWIRPSLRPGRRPSPAEGTGEVRMGRTGPVATSVVGGVERCVSAVCSHLGGVVRWNDAEQSWDCPLHGSRFGPDGEVLDGPATRALRRKG